MNHLKFRVWNPKSKVMLGDNQGQIVVRLNGELRDSLTGHGSAGDVPERNPRWPTMQWTGLKDSKKKRIYEGDFVRYLIPWNGETVTRLIKWDKDFLGFVAGSQEKTFVLLHELQDMENLEVIGNIYENPDVQKTI
jgi:hypothetical protein